jgi:hypothetical protein
MQRSLFVRQGGLYSGLAALPLTVVQNAKSILFLRLVTIWAVAAACGLASPLRAQPARQVLSGHVPPVTKRLTSIGRLESGAHLDLAIGLPLRDREKLTNLLEELSQPSSPNFRHYLTADQFASSFGPNEEDYQAVIDFAKSHGLIVKGTHPNRTLLDVSGSVADIEKAFHITMRVYQHPVEARTFYAPDVEPSLDLGTPVLAISGLDSYVRPRPQLRPGVPDRAKIRTLGGGGSGGGGGGGGGGGSGPSGYYIGNDFRAAYAPGVTNLGTGQYLGLFELTGYSSQDISDYVSEANLNPVPPLQNILIDGFDGDDTNVDYAVEATADIEMSISMAPGLNGVLVYEGPTPLYETPIVTNNWVQYASTTAQINDVFNQMATDDLASQLSCSYEMDINLSTVQIFQQFAAQGQSLFQGSGDGGAFTGAIDEPSDDPYLTVVGGTTLTTASPGGSWVSEVVWLNPASYVLELGLIPVYTPETASGGGVSLTYDIPVWQQGVSMTANQGSTTMRDIPDVAMVATNIDVVYGNDYIGESFDFDEAGTSLSTPLWAGFMALANQQAADKGQPRIGFANPSLYAIGKSTNYDACFHDVTMGNNFTASSPSKFTATVGYDLCSGWGSPTGSNLIKALLAPPSEKLALAPPLGFTSFGPGGGPFTVASQTFTLTNIGSTALNWSLVNTSSWLTVSATAGTLNPGEAATNVTVSLNPTASSFLIGNYSANVVIDNLTDGTSQNRQFDLYVGNGGFETGDFTGWNLVGDTNLVFVLAGDDTDVAGTNALPGVSDWLFVHSGLYGAYLGEWDWDGDPSEGSLSQTVATTAGRQYTVSFWLTSVADASGSTTPNNFIARWNGSTLYAQTNLGAFAWTYLQFSVPATSGSTTLEFDFNVVPGGFGLDDVRVETPSVPAFQSATLSGGALALSWNSIADHSCQLQATSDLSTPNWTNVVAMLTTNGNLVTASQPIGGASQKFYRVVLLPAQ